MNRRRFLELALYLPVVYAAATVLAKCAPRTSSPTDNGAPSNGSCSDGVGVSYTNPGHAHTTLTLSAAQLTAAVPGNYTLLGGSHNHTFNLTAGDFTNLQAGATVTKQDLEGDLHLIDIRC